MINLCITWIQLFSRLQSEIDFLNYQKEWQKQNKNLMNIKEIRHENKYFVKRFKDIKLYQRLSSVNSKNPFLRWLMHFRFYRVKLHNMHHLNTIIFHYLLHVRKSNVIIQFIEGHQIVYCFTTTNFKDEKS